MSTVTLTGPEVVPQGNPLSEEHHHAIAAANQRGKKIRKAASVAAFNGWVTGFFAVTSAPFALFSSVGFVVTAGLTIVAYNEFQGRRRLLGFDPEAARFLGRNQLGFLTLIVGYCLWMLYTGLTGESPIAAEMAAKPELRDALGSVEEFDWIYRLFVGAVYGTVIVLSIVFQGWNAYYYFSRRRHIDQYVSETPEWVRDVQRATNAT